MEKREQSEKEERLNALSHVFGIIWVLIVAPFCLVKAYYSSTPIILFSVALFTFGMVAVYTSSTFYHYIENVSRKKILKKLDHISIFFLIAGTYTPFIAKYVPATTAIWFLSIMWGIVAVGIFYKLFFIYTKKWISTLIYLCLGWMIVFVIKPIIEFMPFNVFLWILIGGLAYTIGVYFYTKSNKMYYHAIWHVFVLIGSMAHTIGVYIALS